MRVLSFLAIAIPIFLAASDAVRNDVWVIDLVSITIMLNHLQNTIFIIFHLLFIGTIWLILISEVLLGSHEYLIIILFVIVIVVYPLPDCHLKGLI